MSNFYNLLNNDLNELEKGLRKEVKPDFSIPNFFIIGLPRSGTTLLSQIIFNYFKVGCSNTFIAKFWDVPLVGFKIFNEVFSFDLKSDFESTYGVSTNPFSPHEFSYFWQRLILMSSLNTKDYNASQARKKIDWDNMNKLFHQINSISKLPIVYKPLELVGYHLEEFEKKIQNSHFIYIERNSLDVGISLAEGRVKRMGDISKWYSSYPEKKNSVNKMSYAEQIFFQVNDLKEMYHQKLSNINKSKLLRISFENLQLDPEREIQKLGSFLKLEPSKVLKLNWLKQKKKSNNILTEMERLEIQKVFENAK